MDLYVLDSLLRRTAVIDQYESLIWTERYAAWGDFELVIRSDRGVRALLPNGAAVTIQQSKYVMFVETIERSTSDEGFETLKFTGRSMESHLEQRVNRNGSVATGAAVLPWTLTGTPGNIIRLAFDTICRTNSVVPSDNLPFLAAGTISPAGSIPEPSTSVTMTFETMTLYEMLTKVAAMYNLGIRLIRNGDLSQVYFEVYTGNDRTTLQTVNSTVVFSPNLDNLSDANELTSTADLKNVAYVFAKNGSRMVYGPNVPTTVSGFERRVLMVDAMDLETAAGATLNAELDQRGLEALSEHRAVIAFDGEIPQRASYVYGVHYGLGDLVEMRNDDGLATNMRVTEQIFVSDKEGVRSYPTLTIDLLITPGTWYAWDASRVWDDESNYWADV